MQYTETQLSKLIEDVEKEFTAHLAKAEVDFKTSLAKSEGASESVAQVELLAKAESEKKPDDKGPKSDKEHAEPKGEAPAAKEGADNEKGASTESHAPQVAAKEGADNEKGTSTEGHAAQAAAHEGADNQQGHDYDSEDMAHLEKMYMSMSDGERKAHHDVIAKLAKCGEMAPSTPKGALGQKSPDNNAEPAIQKSEGAEPKRENGGKIEAAPLKATPGAKSPASKAEGVQMEKSENSELDLLKTEFEAQKAKSEGLQKSLDAVSAFLTKLVEKKVAPAGKAITSLDVIAKSENGQEEKTLSKGEIDTALSKKAQDPKLEKSDRDAINAYYLSGASINSISHLLK